MEELVKFLAQSLVEDPEQVQVSVRTTHRSHLIRLHVAQPDMGRVIGKSGRVANAIRELLHATAADDGKEIILKIA